jgi:hypothetical protein
MSSIDVPLLPQFAVDPHRIKVSGVGLLQGGFYTVIEGARDTVEHGSSANSELEITRHRALVPGNIVGVCATERENSRVDGTSHLKLLFDGEYAR